MFWKYMYVKLIPHVHKTNYFYYFIPILINCIIFMYFNVCTLYNHHNLCSSSLRLHLNLYVYCYCTCTCMLHMYSHIVVTTNRNRRIIYTSFCFPIYLYIRSKRRLWNVRTWWYFVVKYTEWWNKWTRF